MVLNDLDLFMGVYLVFVFLYRKNFNIFLENMFITGRGCIIFLVVYSIEFGT